MIKLKIMNSSLYEITAYSSSSIARLQAQIEEVTLMIENRCANLQAKTSVQGDETRTIKNLIRLRNKRRKYNSAGGKSNSILNLFTFFLSSERVSATPKMQRAKCQVEKTSLSSAKDQWFQVQPEIIHLDSQPDQTHYLTTIILYQSELLNH